MNANGNILLAEDEAALGSIVSESLATRGFSVTHVTNGREALRLLLAGSFDLAVIDVMMPELDGFTVVQRLRMEDKTTPVLFLTSKTMPHDVVTGFESGGNDYLKKPFGMEELVVRIRALLSSNRLLTDAHTPVQIMIGRYSFNTRRQELTYEGSVRKLTARENEVLSLLCHHKQTLLSKQLLLNTIWGDDNFFNARTADVFISRLRKYLQQDAQVQIINVRGMGYKLVW